MSLGTDVGRRPEAAIGPVPSLEKDAGAQLRCPLWWRKCCPCAGKGSESYDVSRGLEESPPAVEDTRQLIMSLDLRTGRQDINKKMHHTQDFEEEGLIVRRGFPFHLELSLSQPFNPHVHHLLLELRLGNNPQVAKGTLVRVLLVEEAPQGEWALLLSEEPAQDRTLHLLVQVPPDCPIGRYRLSLSLGSELQESSVYVLFNPWCPEDVVYLEGEEEREEYVLNETGRIYYGTEAQIGARTWNYGQFSKGILEASLRILEKGGLPAVGHRNAVSVVRTVSAMVNSQDDAGVLVGRWSGDYTGGTSPTSWVGSVGILLQFYRTGRPVSYGQCWVFSGVTTTVLRCLGIPARSVTNFASAHDTDVSLTTDVFLDHEMRPLDHLNCDSIWNFHVWNDCWLARPDLPVGYGGWQAVDATPQETSSGMYRCGPASLVAIRNGMVYLMYDAPFIFAEVNSDKVYWQRQADGTFQKVLVQKKVVGHRISTKAVGSDEREDITHLYKHPEDSEEERIAVETACRYGSRPDTSETPVVPNEVEASLRVEDGAVVGEDFAVSVTLVNHSSEPRSLALFTQAAVMHYTGVCRPPFRKDRQDVPLEPQQEMEVKLTYQRGEYLPQLLEQAAIMFTVTGRLRETGQLIVLQQGFRLRTPDLRLRPLGKAVVGQPMKVEVVLTNPLPFSLAGVVLRFEGSGLQEPRTFKIGDVPQHGTITVTETLEPSRPGRRCLVASLDSQPLTQVHGVAEILVLEE
ncbi:protein-glutamine gamma-glutamyltransferase K-like [Narcine bancroftii]|uniref:protein-glutamine gamma-glutamyltransferase K-like n=1 Tax=Narcine bancroftii TaxID=1343680 RepID=UPI003831027C